VSNNVVSGGSVELIPSGYLHPAYAEALSEFGKPRLLPSSGGVVLQRHIRNSSSLDGMGCYPIFSCHNWSKLHDDLEKLGNELISLALVTDPFGYYDTTYLQSCFPDLVKAFKEHYVVDLTRPVEEFVVEHNRRNARRALGEMQIERCDVSEELLADWLRLYSNLIARHKISGIATFSPQSFLRQLLVPGLTIFRAVRDAETLGMIWWYEHENRAYYHLAAYSAAGYDLRASFALFRYSIDYFAKQEMRWLSLGAGAGSTADATSGLARFKQGWSTGTRTAYFCGRVFDPEKYQELVRIRNPGATDYFPAYRVGEFL